MKVFYRLCDLKIETSKKSPILANNLFKLNKLCLQSFVNAFQNVKPQMVFICDFCPTDKYDQMIQEIVPFEKEIHFTELGINETCLLQYEMAKNVEDTLLFQECDYFYRPNTGNLLDKAINYFGLVSPYDHLNFYIDRDIHSTACDIELFGDYHFRSVERNTMTFGMTPDVFRKNYNVLMKWGYLDGTVWADMRLNGNKLWTPIPSIATHMVDEFISPNIDWKTLWTTLM